MLGPWRAEQNILDMLFNYTNKASKCSSYLTEATAFHYKARFLEI